MPKPDISTLSPEAAAYVAMLEQAVLDQKATITDLQNQVKTQTVKIDRLNEILLIAQRARFGRSSEKRTYVMETAPYS